MKNNNTRTVYGQLCARMGFSFVELIIVIAVIALISVIGLSINNNYTEKSKNSKITSDVKTIQTSLKSYRSENKTLPLPKGNQKYFDDSANYAHYDDTNAYGVYGYITEDTIPKKYMNYTPIDPRTNQYYAYGKTLSGSSTFEVSGVNKINNRFESVVIGDYVGDNGPYNLIREYNGPDFVYDKSKDNFPYNPEERVVKAKIGSFSGTVKVNNKNIDKNWANNNELITGDIIEVSAGSNAEIYYSDGSKSYLGDEWKDSKLVLANMIYKGENNLFTKIQLALDYGSIWTKTSRLDTNSDFEIYTTDTEAAVRGTIFGVEKNYASTDTFVKVIIGKVEVYKLNGLNFGTLISDLGSETTIPTVNFNLSMTSVSSAIVNTNENLHMYGGGSYTGALYLPPNFSIPNEDGLENIQPKIKSIDSGKVTLEFPSSFSGSSNEKEVYKDNAILQKINYNYDGNKLILFGTITPDNYTIKVCDANGIKCTKEVSINKNLSYNGTPNACNPPYNVQFSGEYNECVEMDKSLVDDGFNISAYAPYDGDYYLYYDTGALKDTPLINGSVPFTVIDGVNQGVFLTGSNNYVKHTLYSSMLSNNFALEMKVRGKALKKPLISTDVNYLFKTDKYNLRKLFSSSVTKIMLFESSSSEKILQTIGGVGGEDYDLSLLDDNSYYKVIFKKDGGTGTLIVNGKPFSKNTFNTTNTLGSYIEVGSYPSSSYQWNDTIDYIKIYKKP